MRRGRGGCRASCSRTAGGGPREDSRSPGRLGRFLRRWCLARHKRPINASPSLGNPDLDAHQGLRARTENDPVHERVAQSRDDFFLLGREVHLPEDASDLVAQEVEQVLLAACSPPSIVVSIVLKDPDVPQQIGQDEFARLLAWQVRLQSRILRGSVDGPPICEVDNRPSRAYTAGNIIKCRSAESPGGVGERGTQHWPSLWPRGESPAFASVGFRLFRPKPDS